MPDSKLASIDIVVSEDVTTFNTPKLKFSKLLLPIFIEALSKVTLTLELLASAIVNCAGVSSKPVTNNWPEEAFTTPFQSSPVFNSTFPPVNRIVEPVVIVVITSFEIILPVEIFKLPLWIFNIPPVAFNILLSSKSVTFNVPETKLTVPNHLSPVLKFIVPLSIFITPFNITVCSEYTRPLKFVVSFNVNVPIPEIEPKIVVLPFATTDPLFVILPKLAMLLVVIFAFSLFVIAVITNWFVELILPVFVPAVIVNSPSFFTIPSFLLVRFVIIVVPPTVKLPALSTLFAVKSSLAKTLAPEEFTTFSRIVVPEIFKLDVFVNTELIVDEIIFIVLLLTTSLFIVLYPASTRTPFKVTVPTVFLIALVFFAKITFVRFATAPSLFNSNDVFAFWIVTSFIFIVDIFTNLNPLCLIWASISFVSLTKIDSSLFTFFVGAPPKSITEYLASSFVYVADKESLKPNTLNVPSATLFNSIFSWTIVIEVLYSGLTIYDLLPLKLVEAFNVLVWDNIPILIAVLYSANSIPVLPIKLFE